MKKKILVTGASGGIGSAIARVFAQNGYHVILHYHQNRESAEYLQNLFAQNGCDCDVFCADLTSGRDISRLASFAGRVDVLVNNAGTACSKQLTDHSSDELIRIVNTNLVSAMLLTKAVLPDMLAHGSGKIINISSIWGIAGASCEVVYSAAKAGLIGFTKALAKEVGPSGLCVNCIAPGIIKTNMTGCYSQEELDALAGDTPLRRLGEPSEIASLAFYLASDKADFITGQVISPNGGFVI